MTDQELLQKRQRIVGFSDARRGVARRHDDPDYLQSYEEGLTTERIFPDTLRPVEQISMFGTAAKGRKTPWD